MLALCALLPLSALVGLPVCQIETTRFAVRPRRARSRKRLIIVTIKYDNDPLVDRAIRRQASKVDNESDAGAVRIVFTRDEHDRLIRCVVLAPGSMRKERVLAIGPQMSVERICALLGTGLDRDQPAAL